MPDPDAVNSMFSRIAHRYDLANHLLSGGIDIWWRRRLMRAVSASHPESVLDLATGSGDVAFALSSHLDPKIRIVGMDFCQPMLDQAKMKKVMLANPIHDRIAFQLGDGLNIPYPDKSFDAVTIAFGLRNMADRHRCLSEMARVLRRGGAVYILEFSQPYRWFRPVYLAYLRHVLPCLAGWMTGDRKAYAYLNNSIETFPDRVLLAGELLRAGLSRVQSSALTFGVVALHQGTKD